ncbi:MAG: Calx-beta domain-containing protein, partial [Planctomycetales bacterium]
MLLSNIWEIRRRLQGKRSMRRARGFNEPVQALEQRVYLSASTLFSNGELSIVIKDGNDSVAVGTNPNNASQVQVLVNGLPDGSLPALSASEVERLTIFGSDSENLIDLSGVSTSAFTFVSPVTNAALQITVEADNGDDTIIASDGFDDTLDGGDGNDVITISSGLGNLTIFGDDGNDTITGGAGNDTIDAHDGDDVVDAGDGDDSVIGGNGADSLDGNLGDDTVLGGDGSDSIDGGLGGDTLNGQSGFDTIIGNAGNDFILGGSHADSLRGGDGDDTIVGNGGDDFIDSDAGEDSVAGSAGNDTIYGNSGNDTLNGQAGDDSIIADSGNDLVRGGAGADTINGARGDDTVLGQGDDDSLCGGGGADSVQGGVGTDVITSACPFGQSVSIDDVTIEPEQNFGTFSVNFTVTLSSAFDHEVIVDYVTRDGTASSTAQPVIGTSDFTASAGRLLFLPGELVQTISISVTADTLVEADENFFVILQNAERAEIANGYGEGRIVNDDLPPAPLLDLAVALDDTTSFAPVAPILAAEFPGIVQSIEQALPGFDVGFGVSRFEDYGGETPFILNQPIISTSTFGFAAAIDSALQRAATSDQGNTDNPESLLEALYQVATGVGFDGNANGSRLDNGVAGLVTTQTSANPSGDVPPFSSFVPDPVGPVLPPTENGPINDGMGFRNPDVVNNQESIRLLIVGTDAALKYLPDGIDPYVGIDGITVPASTVQNGAGIAPAGTAGVLFTAGASIQDTINELVQRNIRVIGIGGDSGNQQADPTDPNGAIRQPLEALALLTGGINESGVVIQGSLPNDPIDPGDPLYFSVATTDTNAGTVLADSLVQAVLGSVGPAEISAQAEVVLEGENGLRQVSLTVRLSRPPSVDSTVQYEFIDGTATNGADFVANGGILTFAATTQTSAGDFVQTITIDINDDDLVEGDEQFSLRLFNASPGLSFSDTDPAVTDLITTSTIIDVDVPSDAGDTLWGAGGNDSITGGAGDDFINGMSGDDVIDGGDGNDSLLGGSGMDTLQGGGGNDSLLGQG